MSEGAILARGEASLIGALRQMSRWSEETSHGDTWGRTCQAEGTAGTSVLRQRNV